MTFLTYLNTLRSILSEKYISNHIVEYLSLTEVKENNSNNLLLFNDPFHILSHM